MSGDSEFKIRSFVSTDLFHGSIFGHAISCSERCFIFTNKENPIKKRVCIFLEQKEKHLRPKNLV